MIMVVASIYDNVAQAYMRPMFFRSEGEATRAFMDAVNNPETEFNKHPDDYTLVQVATWDEDEGVMHEESADNLFITARSVYKPALEVTE